VSLVNFGLLKSSKLTIHHFGRCKIKEFFKNLGGSNQMMQQYILIMFCLKLSKKLDPNHQFENVLN